MSGAYSVFDGVNAALAGNAVANAFWVFVGIVAGAMVQYFLGLLSLRGQRKNALRALKTEVELNLSELQIVVERVDYLRTKISAQQVNVGDLFISFQGFDYSILQPLVASGHFHVTLGPDKAKKYFEFMRFFNNHSAEIINSMLKTEHSAGKSLDYLIWFKNRSDELRTGLASISSK